MKQKVTKIRRIEKLTIIDEDLSTFLSVIDRTSRQNNQSTEDLNNTISKLTKMTIYWSVN